jgi:hypothetical protein
MKYFVIVIATTIYVLIAVRIAFVQCRIESESGRRSYPMAILTSAVWPVVVMIVGFGILISGDPGIFTPGWKYHQ